LEVFNCMGLTAAAQCSQSPKGCQLSCRGPSWAAERRGWSAKALILSCAAMKLPFYLWISLLGA
jgi:hypothetical protein